MNPITDVCWECLLPVSIGPITIGSATGAPDTSNPSSPICFCGSPIPRIGLSLGVWEPARLMDVSRAPWCFPNLGGLTIDPGLPAARGRTGSSGGDGASGSVWHVHYYVYPLLSGSGRCSISAVSKQARSTSPGPRSWILPGSTTSCRSC